ncbi:heterokaryon incompatibility protein 6, OR allele [Podospora aff. communis PSN243]|uniref:Heterokaryon incompatibility protein 6, OR allele n=1 Tax=Podospora aff. communis PSN243 TaxID=3040156 RepID=A0AAV9FYS3_9PEZI|nr:heterokaryon incompatibility protein 6, OR allele [Podospora aff. communis PSN243]
MGRNLGGIDWVLLPNTFRDAIDFTRRLELRFLWIDSICIIQDSDQDWQQQSALMGDIYGGAYITLCATASPNSDEGLYVPLFEHQQPYNIEVQGPEDLLYSVNVETALKDSHMPPWRQSYYDSFKNMSGFPVIDRAWAFQERVLSPRLLHFCSKAYYPTKPHGPSRLLANYKGSYKRLVAAVNPQPQYKRNSESQWDKVVNAYSSLHLTRDSDRLPALSGIAKREQTLRGGDQYLAGLWKKTLIYDMLWHSARSGTATRLNPKRVPSWSWAAVHGRVEYYEYNRQAGEMCTVIEAATTLAGSDPTGEVSGGHILLSGPTAVVEYSEVEQRPILGRGEDSHGFSVDCDDDFHFKKGQAARIQVGDNLTCLGVILPRWGNDKIFVLILRLCESAERSGPKTYKRVGCIETSAYNTHFYKFRKRYWTGIPEETLRIV